MYKFDILFFKRFSNVSSKLCRSRSVFLFFSFLILLRLLQEYLIYNVGVITAGYYKVIGSRDLNGFTQQTLKSIALILANAIILSSCKYVSSILYLSWRRILTSYIHSLYFENCSFYYVNVIDKTIDNPDQRITQDVDKLCSTLSTIIPVLVISPFTIAYYTFMSYNTTGWVGPTSVLCYFLVGTFINKFLMSAVVWYVYLQEKLEGHFRYQHMHVRTNAESIAFQCGSKSELFYVNRDLMDLINAQEKQYLRRLPLDMSVNIFNYLGSIVSFLVLAIPVFSGKYDDLSTVDLSALISQNTFVTMYLISCFSNLVSLSDDLATLAGVTHRVTGLLEYLENMRSKMDCNKGQNNDSAIAKGPLETSELLEIENLSYTCPKDENFLLENLNLKLYAKNNILICGKSGCGKTSLFRILKGLWSPVIGKVHFYSDEFNYTMFMPQKALLLPKGTLREQIVYPLINTEEQIYLMNDDEIMRYLKIAGLSTLVNRINPSGDESCLDLCPEWNWYDALSPGEMQRLTFLRIFYHCPKIAFLDEALSAISSDMENKLYEICHQLGVTVVSIGYRASLLKHHKIVLKLCENKQWMLVSSDNEELIAI